MPCPGTHSGNEKLASSRLHEEAAEKTQSTVTPVESQKRTCQDILVRWYKGQKLDAVPFKDALRRILENRRGLFRKGVRRKTLIAANYERLVRQELEQQGGTIQVYYVYECPEVGMNEYESLTHFFIHLFVSMAYLSAAKTQMQRRLLVADIVDCIDHHHPRLDMVRILSSFSM
jgi:hypothetical protein